jgi:HK97 family phage portal protein
MRLLGFEIARVQQKSALPVPDSGRGWYPLVREPFTGAWQRNITVDRQSVLSNHAAFACLTLIASDISKLRCKLVEQTKGIWTETDSPAFSPVLRKPNRYQNRIQFWESWILSKLTHGNAYVLKERDQRGVVVALYVLNPQRVKALVADDGSVFYDLNTDNISGLQQARAGVPASEIIHDRFNCLFHPLVGLSPIFAAGVAAMQGNAIQNNSTAFFANKSQPGGIIVYPGRIDKEDATRVKEAFDANYSGENAGRVAVIGDGAQYHPMAINAVDSQLIEQLKWTAEVVCSTFHVPPYKIGVGQMPPYTNVQALNVEYYSQCLQVLIEAAELCLDEGLGLTAVGGKTLGTEFDVDNLLRMDTVTQMEVLDKGKNIMKPDEARAKLDLPPVKGGDQVYRQQQDYSLAALAKRDAREDPFASAPKPAPAAEPAKPPEQPKPDVPANDVAAHVEFLFTKAVEACAA